MSPISIARSPILSTISRSAFKNTASRPAIRFASTASARAAGAQGTNVWGSHLKKVGGTAMMYFPVVGVLMFWPYATMPVMEYFEARW